MAFCFAFFLAGPLSAQTPDWLSKKPWSANQQRSYQEAWTIFISMRIMSNMSNKGGDPDLLFSTKTSTWNVTTPDGWNISGWSVLKPGSPGTVLVVHGVGEHSRSQHAVLDPAQFLYNDLGYSIAALDLRFHGNSGAGIPTFGPAEAWDIRTALDHLEKQGYPQPFYLLGTSLGAMASANAVFQDTRINGAFLVMPPASSALAIKTKYPPLPGWVHSLLYYISPRISSPDLFVNDTYGADVIGMGDLSQLQLAPNHKPNLLVVMATDDEFKFGDTKKAWESWFPGENAEYNKSPAQARNQHKWLIERDPEENNGYWGHGLSPLWPEDNRRLLREFFTPAGSENKRESIK